LECPKEKRPSGFHELEVLRFELFLHRARFSGSSDVFSLQCSNSSPSVVFFAKIKLYITSECHQVIASNVSLRPRSRPAGDLVRYAATNAGRWRWQVQFLVKFGYDFLLSHQSFKRVFNSSLTVTLVTKISELSLSMESCFRFTSFSSNYFRLCI
jgi:hypothetical protein